MNRLKCIRGRTIYQKRSWRSTRIFHHRFQRCVELSKEDSSMRKCDSHTSHSSRISRSRCVIWLTLILSEWVGLSLISISLRSEKTKSTNRDARLKLKWMWRTCMRWMHRIPTGAWLRHSEYSVSISSVSHSLVVSQVPQSNLFILSEMFGLFVGYFLSWSIFKHLYLPSILQELTKK